MRKNGKLQASFETVPIDMHFPWVVRKKVQQMKLEKAIVLQKMRDKMLQKNANSKTYTRQGHEAQSTRMQSLSFDLNALQECLRLLLPKAIERRLTAELNVIFIVTVDLWMTLEWHLVFLDSWMNWQK